MDTNTVAPDTNAADAPDKKKRTRHPLPAPEMLAYTPSQAALALNLSKRTIYREIEESRLEARRPFPRVTLIPAESLKAWLLAKPPAKPVNAAA